MANRQLVEAGTLDGIVIAFRSDVTDIDEFERDSETGCLRSPPSSRFRPFWLCPMIRRCRSVKFAHREKWNPVPPPLKTGGRSGSSPTIVSLSIPETKFPPGYSPGLILSVVPEVRSVRADRNDAASRTIISLAQTRLSGGNNSEAQSDNAILIETSPDESFSPLFSTVF